MAAASDPAKYAVPAQGDVSCQMATGDWCSLSATTPETRAVFSRYCVKARAATGSNRSMMLTCPRHWSCSGVSQVNTRAAMLIDSAIPAVLNTFLCQVPLARLDDAKPSRAAVKVARSPPNTMTERKTKASANDTRQCGSGSLTESRPTRSVRAAIPSQARCFDSRPLATTWQRLCPRTAAPTAATAPMKTLPFMSPSLRESMGLPLIGQPPDQPGVPQAPDEAHVEAAVAADTPDQTAGRDVEEIIRDRPVRPDQSGGVQSAGPDEAARHRRHGIPGDVVPLIVLSEHDAG